MWSGIRAFEKCIIATRVLCHNIMLMTRTCARCVVITRACVYFECGGGGGDKSRWRSALKRDGRVDDRMDRGEWWRHRRTKTVLFINIRRRRNLIIMICDVPLSFQRTSSIIDGRVALSRFWLTTPNACEPVAALNRYTQPRTSITPANERARAQIRFKY